MSVKLPWTLGTSLDPGPYGMGSEVSGIYASARLRPTALNTSDNGGKVIESAGNSLLKSPNNIVLGPLGLTVKRFSYVSVISLPTHATSSCK